MTGREALKALADGKKVRTVHPPSRPIAWGDSDASLSTFELVDRWEVVEEPATDEELIAAMETLANRIERGTTCANPAGVARLCARMLRERKVEL